MTSEPKAPAHPAEPRPSQLVIPQPDPWVINWTVSDGTKTYQPGEISGAWVTFLWGQYGQPLSQAHVAPITVTAVAENEETLKQATLTITLDSGVVFIGPANDPGHETTVDTTPISAPSRLTFDPRTLTTPASPWVYTAELHFRATGRVYSRGQMRLLTSLVRVYATIIDIG